MMDKGIDNGLNWRVFTKVDRPDPTLVARFEDIPVCPIDDVCHRMAACDSAIRPFNDNKVVGTAVTVKLSLANASLFNEAIEIAQPGDVIVASRGIGTTEVASCGGNMYSFAMAKGVRGFIVDGAIRDIGELRGMQHFNVYARAVSPNGSMNNGIGPGEINVPIACGGIVVFPGDIIVADEDGIVAIRPGDAEEIADLASAIAAKDAQQARNLKDGKATRAVTDALKREGCHYFDTTWDGW